MKAFFVSSGQIKASFILLVLLSGFSACTWSSPEDPYPKPLREQNAGHEVKVAAMEVAASPPPAAVAQVSAQPKAVPDQSVEIATDGDNLSFTKTAIQAKAGSTLRVQFSNRALGSKMAHNWVLVRPGKVEVVAQEGIAAGESNGWLKESPNVIAHTKLIAAGEKEAITFLVPSEPGDYPFVCTFPGHSTVMKGILSVK